MAESRPVHPTTRPGMMPASAPLDIAERGAPRDGVPQRSDRRLFVQLLVLDHCAHHPRLVNALQDDKAMVGALYLDLNHPRRVGLVTMSQDPQFFVGPVRELLSREPFDDLTVCPELTMLGRTYAIGYEPDLDDTLLHRPERTITNPAWPWAIWYPLRRSGKFTHLPEEEQKAMLREHGQIGFSFGQADYAHDIRLACHGLDQHDNDFVIGVVGRVLAPLSILVQTMRKTQQTSLYLENLGPFFVGRAIWQRPSVSENPAAELPSSG